VCEAWDNCGKCHSSKLEKIQLDAARIETGLPIFTRLILHISKLAGNHGFTLNRDGCVCDGMSFSRIPDIFL
jgi:hypothetical protein